ncbi:glycosyl transferase [Owenweeksia hongkongensis DSM 17368]|uniref:Glycosyl transferase n=1 Tax=Owenweeksia hongkongensis (strain DSM 17368 / CIP 108786 / JCM 12287 / NRRL B-23963 / UST20020801) TaxID=926562 RepID=G8R4M0_OWEHD|nr:glycosyltransferase [Owenweeksia hongkongensis]AEV32109.1 glycosyl transferase [Owenweeksia hongkongensis DSM 17368]
MKRCSLITVVKDEHTHLAKLLHGLLISTHTPAEIILVNVGNNITLPEVTPVGVIKVILDNTDEDISLAAARNAGVRAARYDHLIFLDVDCIPSSSFVENILEIMQHTDGLVMGQPRLIEENIDNHFTEQDLLKVSKDHPETSPIKIALHKENDYSLFRSLCFGVNRKRFEELLAFDGNGENAELSDSEIGNRACKIGIPFYRSNTPVYQQFKTIPTPQ